MRLVHPRRIACALAAVAVVASAPVARAQPSGGRDARPTVAIMYFNNSSLVRNADYAPLTKGIADILISELSVNKGVRVVERDQLQKLLEEQNLTTAGRVDQQTAVQIGKVLGAHHMLMGGFVIDPKETLRLDVRSVNTETSAVEYVETITGKAENILDLISALGKKVNDGLHLPPMPDRRASAPRVDTMNVATTNQEQPKPKPEPKGDKPSPSKANDFRATILLSRALEASDKKDVPGAIALYKAALEIKPDFERAKVLLASLEKSSMRGTN